MVKFSISSLQINRDPENNFFESHIDKSPQMSDQALCPISQFSNSSRSKRRRTESMHSAVCTSARVFGYFEVSSESVIAGRRLPLQILSPLKDAAVQASSDWSGGKLTDRNLLCQADQKSTPLCGVLF